MKHSTRSRIAVTLCFLAASIGFASYFRAILSPPVQVHEMPLRYVGPHVCCLGERLIFCDGKRYGTIERSKSEAIRLVAIPDLDGIVRDISHLSGERLLLLSRRQTSVALYTGADITLNRYYNRLHKATLEGAVLDAGRQRIVTIGADAKPRFPDDLYGEGTVSVFGFDGLAIGRPHKCNGPPLSIARDGATNTVVVGTTNGWVHVLKCGLEGLEPLPPYRLKHNKLYSVEIASDGEYIAATGRGIAAIWRRGGGEPLVEFNLGPGDDGGSVVCFCNDHTKANSARALVFWNRHVWNVSLGANVVDVVEEFDTDVFVHSACHFGLVNEVLVIGLMDPSPEEFHLYSLNVESKAVTAIPWTSP